MEKEFIPYEQALELKELGFDEPCFCIYNREKKLRFNNLHNPQDRNKGVKLTSNNGRYPAPTFSQCFRFFREKYNIYTEILLDQTTQPKFCFEIHKYEDFGNYEEIRIGEWFLYRTYEEAELECIKHLIKVVEGY